MILIDTEPQRLVPLDTWTHENTRNLAMVASARLVFKPCLIAKHPRRLH